MTKTNAIALFSQRLFLWDRPVDGHAKSGRAEMIG